ncbi:hypothetical protein MASR1M66_05660 [Aminivibrio sp.]
MGEEDGDTFGVPQRSLFPIEAGRNQCSGQSAFRREKGFEAREALPLLQRGVPADGHGHEAWGKRWTMKGSSA